MTGVLFVCTGNKCRSPLAEAHFKFLLQKNTRLDFTVASAGTWISGGQRADARMVSWAKKNGIDLSGHTTRQLSSISLTEFSLIVVMTKGHKEALSTNYPEVGGSIVGLSELCGPFYDIPDPVSLPDEEFEEVAKEVVNLVEKGFHATLKRVIKKTNP